MKLSEFNAKQPIDANWRVNPAVKCNALYKSAKNLNCYLRASEAIQLARNLLEKAQLVLDENLDDAAVQLWSSGPDSERLLCGLTEARKGGRTKRRKS